MFIPRQDLPLKIIKLLARQSPLRATTIAILLGADRYEVNLFLHSCLKDRVCQNGHYRWSLVEKSNAGQFTSVNHNSHENINNIQNKLVTNARHIEEQILQILAQHYPIRASYIVDHLHTTTAIVNQYLYGSLYKQLQKDSQYRWSLTAEAYYSVDLKISTKPSSEVIYANESSTTGDRKQNQCQIWQLSLLEMPPPDKVITPLDYVIKKSHFQEVDIDDGINISIFNPSLKIEDNIQVNSVSPPPFSITEKGLTDKIEYKELMPIYINSTIPQIIAEDGVTNDSRN